MMNCFSKGGCFYPESIQGNKFLYFVGFQNFAILLENLTSGGEQKRRLCLAGTGPTKLIRSKIALIDTTSLDITVSGSPPVEKNLTYLMLW